MNSRTIFSYILSSLVVIITILSLLAIWNIIEWQYIERYMGKTIQSLIVIIISAIVIYLIQSILYKKEITGDKSGVNS